MRRGWRIVWGTLWSFWWASCAASMTAMAAEAVIPHGQHRAPNEALAPAEAVARMKVPPGFQVELVASEPEIVNPVAMTFDERGRIWLTESLEYPRRSAGKGRDRVKVLDDTDGDGKADTFSVFADGLNIPSGIAVGYGGVWVANAPDLLFLRDTDGDGRADTSEVIVTGFGRADTHELPNSLTWGPDGWLYGWNGVFNPSHVVYRGKTHDFTCAIFRIHPRTRDFELFCEGTSNPWGIAWDPEGSAFASACVIDHLWHLTETGYYHRQGGPYPPFTWKIGSIVRHSHQKAAYCGIHYVDSDAYPPAYRDRLFMGNIHGNSINVDRLHRAGSTYRAEPEPDFLTANDAWFMPVSQKIGPDGCLYVLDWYDRYHCYQDANRDPQGIDRLKGRLYRVRYRQTPRAPRTDLASESDDQLIERLASPNLFWREQAQRLLAERNRPETRQKLQSLVAESGVSRKTRMHALWTLVSGGPLDREFHRTLLANPDAGIRAWGVRAAGNQRHVDGTLRSRIISLARDPAPDVALQVAVAARKIEEIDAVALLVDVAAHCGNDELIPHIVWQNLHPLLEDQADRFVQLARSAEYQGARNLAALMPRVIERLLARRTGELAPVLTLVDSLADSPDPSSQSAARTAFEGLASRIQSGELAGKELEDLRDGLRPLITRLLAASPQSPLAHDAALLATSWNDPAALKVVRKLFVASDRPDDERLRALGALVRAGDRECLPEIERLLAARDASPEFLAQVVAALGRLDDPHVADLLLENYPRLDVALRSRAVDLLTERASWSKALLTAMGKGTVAPDALDVNQVRKLLASKDDELVKLVRSRWGTVREGRNPAREQVIQRMRAAFRKSPGDPLAGAQSFKKLCAQCHKIYGEGQEVGPDLTSNGRASYEQLLSNVFDPSLVIGSAYQATTVATSDGRILTGLLAEDSPQRVVLKTQGGKLETIARQDVEEMKVSALSLMPEDIEKQLSPGELSDLFAFLTLDKPPGDPDARPIPGTREIPPRAATDPAQFQSLLDEFAPGFSTVAVGEGGLAIVEEHFGRRSVLRTHPIDRDRPCVLTASFNVPEGKKPRLRLDVAHDRRGDWRLVVKGNGKTLKTMDVSPRTTRDGWAELEIDLSPFAGKTVKLELENQANGWSYEFGYWGRIEIVSE